MTVAQLISKLMEIENKDAIIYIADYQQSNDSLGTFDIKSLDKFEDAFFIEINTSQVRTK
jgi:hypothetical protein